MPYRKITPHPFVVANRLVRGSYVSCQSALAYYALIPEYVPAIVSVTTTRPAHWETPLGDYLYRHIQPRLLSGYRWSDLGNGQQAFVATPAKALLDLIYLQPAGDTAPYLETLRLQNLDRLDLAELTQRAEASGSPKLARAASYITALARREAEEYQPL
jgi:predicted transcriptional regulator of viral defense system